MYPFEFDLFSRKYFTPYKFQNVTIVNLELFKISKSDRVGVKINRFNAPWSSQKQIFFYKKS